jgi:membrane peptidoglycan carboxypeptidase
VIAKNVRPSGGFAGLVGVVGLGILAGVLVTTMITPALATTSVAAKSTIGVFENLPDFIQLGTQSQQNQFYANRDGQPVLIATTFKENRKEVKWDEVSPLLTQAVVAGEDRRFYQHGGVDVSSLARAVIGNLSSGSVQSGGSTLDMQLVKNILVNQAAAIADPAKRKIALDQAKGQKIDRKLKEMKLAIGLDKKYTKQEILLGYLNIVGMGSNTYGVESAAQQYFSVSAKDVTLPQAASLIAIVQQPNLQSLDDPKKYPANKLRRDQILDAMLSLKYIDQKQHDDAIATTIESYVKLSPPISGCRSATDAKLACDYVSKLITATTAAGALGLPPMVLALGATPAERKANFDQGGYKIYTSIDLNLQDAAQAALDVQAPANESRFQLGATANTVEVGTGRILVMAQNKAFDDAPEAAKDPTKTAVNFTSDYPYGGSTGFETGSTYKVFDLANWLQNGHGLNDLVDGRSPQNYLPSDFTAPCDPAQIGGPFKLKNDSGAGGNMTVKQALIGSVNNAFMRMATKQDLCSIRDTAASMGAHLATGKELKVNPNSILGNNPQAPLTMAGAAATIGGSGLHCDPIIVDKIVDPAGKELPGQTKTCSQPLTADVAAGVANAMVGSMTSGTSRLGNPNDKIPIGGKTGTSDVADHVWIMGTTTKIATAVWTGNIVGHQSLRKLSNPITKQNYASYARFNVFRAIMKLADTNPAYKGGAFGVPSATVLGGSSAIVPALAGQTPAQAKSLLESLQFVYVDGGPVPSALPVGRVASTDPATGTKTPTGASVTVYTSDGSLSTVMPNVIGMTRQAANAAITSSGFNPGNVTYTWVQATPGTTVCTVQDSTPAANATAAKSDPVTLTVVGAATADSNGHYDPAPGACPQ